MGKVITLTVKVVINRSKLPDSSLSFSSLLAFS